MKNYKIYRRMVKYSIQAFGEPCGPYIPGHRDENYDWIPNPECYTDQVFEEQGAADKAKLEQMKAEKYNNGFHDIKEEEKFVQVEE